MSQENLSKNSPEVERAAEMLARIFIAQIDLENSERQEKEANEDIKVS